MDAPSTLTKLKASEIEIRECGEEMQLTGDDFVAEPMYFAWGFADNEHILLRSGIIEKLEKVQNCIRSVRGCEKWKLKIWDGFRLLSTQGKIYLDYMRKLANAHKDWSDAKLKEAVEIFVRYPSEDPACPPPHNTGGAVDLTIIDEYGQEVDMGTAFDEFNVRSYTSHFDDCDDDVSSFDSYTPAYDYARCSVIKRNRGLLKRAMESVGFVNYPEEWWHYSYGDQDWALATGADFAIYGRMEL